MESAPEKYFLYVRKSSEEEERQTLSIEAQLEELREFAVSQKLNVTREFQEAKTAKEPGRDVFNEMMEELRRGKANGIIAWNPDRLARNAVDGGLILHFVDKGLITALKFPTFTFENSPQGKFTLMIAFGQAKLFVDNLSLNVKRGIRQKIRRGEFCGKATAGYLNEPRLRTIVPDPKHFNSVKRALLEFANKEFGLTGFRDRLTAFGVMSPRTKGPFSIWAASQILQNPFYYGVCRYRGELYQGVHKPMISKADFDRIQVQLREVGKPRKQKVKLRFQFLGLADCATCRCAITAEEHVKRSGLRFVYYHCTHKRPNPRCPDRRYVREEKIADAIREQAALIALPDVWRDKFLEQVTVWEHEEKAESSAFTEEIRTKRDTVKGKLQRLMDLYLDGEFDLNEFKETKNVLVAEKATLDQKLARHQQTASRRLEPLKQWIFTANTVEKAVLTDDLQQMKRALQKFGSNRLLRDETLSVEFEKPWNLLAKTTVASRFAPDDSGRFNVWCPRQDLNLYDVTH